MPPERDVGEDQIFDQLIQSDQRNDKGGVEHRDGSPLEKIQYVYCSISPGEEESPFRKNQGERRPPCRCSPW